MSESLLHSQAGNFLDFMKTGVDARTGQFNLAIDLPLPPANQLAGPAQTFTLAFSTLSSSVNRGYGLGWSLGLSEVNLEQNSPRLSLGSGEQFAVDLQRSSFEVDEPLQFFDQKLNTLKVTQQADGRLRVDKKSGESEILQQPQAGSARYLLAEIRSAEGRRLYFDWLPFGEDDYILHQVRDEQRVLLSLAHTDAGLTLQLNPDTANRTAMQLLLSNDQLSTITLPGLALPFEIEYDSVQVSEQARLQLPTRVRSPLGAVDTVHWALEGDAHRLPGGGPLPYLPRVSRWTHSSGSADTELHHDYQWIGEQNFLGFGSDQAFEWHTGRDNLYQVGSAYRYQCVETLSSASAQNLGRIERVWNRFHLLISESTRLGTCETLKTTQYGLDPALTWQQQPAWCQLPQAATTHYIDHADKGSRRSETTTYQYDDHGNITHVRYPTGVEETTAYYPVEGAEGCPADPLGMVRFIKKKTTHPAQPSGGAPTLSTAYTYQLLPSLIAQAPAHIVIASETLLDEQDGRVLEHTQQRLVTTPGASYGRPHESITTLNGKPTTRRQAYTLDADQLVIENTTVGFEQDEENRSSTASAQCLRTAQTLWTRSESGVVARYSYDQIGRLVSTVNALDSPFQTEHLVRYHLGDKVAKALKASAPWPMMIEQVEATGCRQRFWLDGDGRTLCIEVEDLDTSPGLFRELARNQYDALGRLVSQTRQDWLTANAAPHRFTTSTAFDDWGQVAKTVDAQGIENHFSRSPITLRSEQWQVSGDLSGPRLVVLANTAGSPIEQQHRDTEGVLVRSLKRVRDGLDRVTEEHLLAPGMPSIITRYRYDHYARVVEKRLADGTTLAWQFAAHSDDQHPEAVTVTATAQETPQ